MSLLFRRSLAALLSAAALLCAGAAQARDPIFIGQQTGAAIDGYDVVAYFGGSAQRGLPSFSIEYKGVEWYFVNDANAAKFRLSPDSYMPAYGGYCAYGVANGYLVHSDPRAWSIHDGRLYLNFNELIRVKWLTNREQFLALSREYWPKLIG